jgi:hypothetical protein
VQFGVIVLTTANGILDHEEARRKKVGGKVLGEYFRGLAPSVGQISLGADILKDALYPLLIITLSHLHLPVIVHPTGFFY